MPHEGDKETSNFDVTTKTYSLRQSQWSGWLQDLDSIKMEYTDTTQRRKAISKASTSCASLRLRTR